MLQFKCNCLKSITSSSSPLLLKLIKIQKKFLSIQPATAEIIQKTKKDDNNHNHSDRTRTSPSHVAKSVKGMKDVFPPSSLHLLQIRNIMRQCAMNNGYLPVESPIVEHSNLYVRSLGSTSDVVQKEMFTVSDHQIKEKDKDNNLNNINQDFGHLVLRPEGTASLVRGMIQAGMGSFSNNNNRFFYEGPMFRVESPQKGRSRQFNQFGVEYIGSNSVHADVEIILLANRIINALGLSKHTKLIINTLGDAESRINYNNKLSNWLKPFIHKLSKDSQLRFSRGNYLRILDSKDPEDKFFLESHSHSHNHNINHNNHNNNNHNNHNINNNSSMVSEPVPFPNADYLPIIQNSLSDEAKSRWDSLLNILTKLNINFQVDQKLVRGLDYYDHTIFEFIAKDQNNNNNNSNHNNFIKNKNESKSNCKNGDINSILNSELALIAGGRYNGLFQLLGGPITPAIGWAGGIERLCMAREEALALSEGLSKNNQFYHVPHAAMAVNLSDSSAAGSIFALNIFNELSNRNVSLIRSNWNSNFSKQIAQASKLGCPFILILGDEEFNNNKISIKNLTNRTQQQFIFNNSNINNNNNNCFDQLADILKSKL